ncbi:MAG: L-threonine 3-dehydrogenase [Chthonomonadales bacterium]|nr:L-threonine 3-dehydrogenase [Chthonomonadales bacterium]
MRAIVKREAGPGAMMCAVTAPTIVRADEVLLRPLLTSICGTDYHVYSWDAWSAARVRPPRIMGHEFVAEVVDVGSDVRALRVGDLVSGESHRVCGVCQQCRTGEGHVCAQTRIFGVDIDGCFAETVCGPEASLWRNPSDMPPDVACIQDPLGNAVHAVMAGDVAGRSFAILGCGPIGLMAIAVARACGASYVVATDTRSYRLDLARQMGADVVLDATECDVVEAIGDTHPNGVDVVLEMSGAPSAIQAAFNVARRGGRVSLMGIPSRPVELDVAESMVMKGLDIRCIVGRRLYGTWATMSALLGSGRLNIAPVITHRLPWTDFAHGMDLMGRGLCGKVVLEMD